MMTIYLNEESFCCSPPNTFSDLLMECEKLFTDKLKPGYVINYVLGKRLKQISDEKQYSNIMQNTDSPVFRLLNANEQSDVNQTSVNHTNQVKQEECQIQQSLIRQPQSPQQPESCITQSIFQRKNQTIGAIFDNHRKLLEQLDENFNKQDPEHLFDKQNFKGQYNFESQKDLYLRISEKIQAQIFEHYLEMEQAKRDQHEKIKQLQLQFPEQDRQILMDYLLKFPNMTIQQLVKELSYKKKGI